MRQTLGRRSKCEGHRNVAGFRGNMFDVTSYSCEAVPKGVRPSGFGAQPGAPRTGDGLGCRVHKVSRPPWSENISQAYRALKSLLPSHRPRPSSPNQRPHYTLHVCQDP